MIYNYVEGVQFAVLTSFLNPLNSSIPLTDECSF